MANRRDAEYRSQELKQAPFAAVKADDSGLLTGVAIVSTLGWRTRGDAWRTLRSRSHHRIDLDSMDGLL